MNPIKILFYALASIIGLEDATVVSRKVSVTMNPVNKTFEIFQEDLFSIIILLEDSIRVADELRHIVAFQNNGRKKSSNGLIVEKIMLSNDSQQLDASITVRYSSSETLADAGIYLDTLALGEFSMMNIPEWNIHSSDAVLKEEYWVWPTDKSVTFVLEPFRNIPDKYLNHLQRILPYWQKLTVTNL